MRALSHNDRQHLCKVALAAWLGMAATGCARGAIPELVEQKHYREAICAAVDHGGKDVVAAALAKDANLHLHAYRVRPAELERVVEPEAAADINKRASFVRLRMQSNTIPVDGYTVRIGFEPAQPAPAAGLPLDWDALAQATNEPLPPKVARRTYVTGENFLKGAAALFTGGMSFFVTGLPKQGTVMVKAPRADFLRYAPKATALHDEMKRAACRPPGIGAYAQARCDTFFVLAGAAKTPWVMRVEQTFMSKRVTVSDHGDEGRCKIVSRHKVPIGMLEPEMDKRFGLRMQPLDRIEAKER